VQLLAGRTGELHNIHETAQDGSRSCLQQLEAPTGKKLRDARASQPVALPRYYLCLVNSDATVFVLLSYRAPVSRIILQTLSSALLLQRAAAAGAAVQLQLCAEQLCDIPR
jgi:hypothetical protein